MNEPSNDFTFFVGIDWATEAHQVCILDSHGSTLKEQSIAHNGTAISQFVTSLTSLTEGDPARVALAIEIPRGALVETFLDRGFAVFSINPKQLDRFRDRHTVAGAKDDRRDAYVLADSLRTDRHCFRRCQIDQPLIIQLREVSRTDEELRDELGRLTNRLRDLLYRFYPQMVQLCSAADEPWVWDLLTLAPTPADGAKLKPKRLEKFLRQHRIRRLQPQQVVDTLRTPPLHLAPGTLEACKSTLTSLLPRLRLAVSLRHDCAQRIESLLQQLAEESPPEGQKREHRDVEILRSLPGVGRIVAAAMLAEASRPIAERNYHALRAHAGIAPVTHATGKRSGPRAAVSMRYGCNHRLRNACYHWAMTATQNDAQARQQYASLRQKGHSHGRALRGLADRLLRILIAMLNNDTVYDPDRPPRVPTGAASLSSVQCHATPNA